MEILFLAAEMSPLFKVGGLADVVGSLPKALARLGHQVRVVLPLHSPQPPTGFSPLPGSANIPLSGREEAVSFWQREWVPGVTVYLIDHPGYFRRGGVYSFDDDLERFTLFSLAALELPSIAGFRPDVVHCHDWHTALALRALKLGPSPAPSLLTIHNIQHQGHFAPEWFARTLDGTLPEGELFRNQGIYPNMLTLGLLYADAVGTVSPTYAREMVTPEFAYGLHPIFARRRHPVIGIVNGIDYEEYNPATDAALPARFDAASLPNRATNKKALQERAGWKPSPATPLFGMVSRLADQKGIDILLPALKDFLPTARAQFVLLGTGEAKYVDMVRQLADSYPRGVAVFFTFDEALARLIYGGSDIFVMPSLFEPCGLGQLIAMRYGAIPLVRHTGGLVDTVTDLSADLASGTGFVFPEYSPQALAATLRRAKAAYAHRQSWVALMSRVMGQDFSWGASALKYQEVYRQLKDGILKSGGRL